MARLNYPSGEITPVASPNTIIPPTRLKLAKHLDITPLEAAVKPVTNIQEALKEKEKLSRDDVKSVLEKALEAVDSLNSHHKVKYEVIEEADLVQVQVIDTDTGNIIRKIPADDIVELVKNIRDVLSERLDIQA